MVFLCIDVGGTNTLVGVGNGDFDVVETIDSAAFLTDIVGSLRSALGNAGFTMDDVTQIATAVAGPMDREDGVFYPPNIDMEQVQILEPLETICDTVEIYNDCTAAALGEYHYGEGHAENLAYLTISTGIGAGIVSDGEVIEGPRGNFGEIGHTIVGDAGLDCGCGGQDHWEAYCSGSNLPRFAEYLTGASFETAITLFEAYYEDNEAAHETVRAMKKYNARGIANVINSYDPDRIVIGGGVALNHAEAVLDGLKDEVENQAVNDVPPIEICSLGDRSVIHGLRAVCNADRPLQPAR